MKFGPPKKYTVGARPTKKKEHPFWRLSTTTARQPSTNTTTTSKRGCARCGQFVVSSASIVLAGRRTNRTRHYYIPVCPFFVCVCFHFSCRIILRFYATLLVDRVYPVRVPTTTTTKTPTILPWLCSLQHPMTLPPRRRQPTLQPLP